MSDSEGNFKLMLSLASDALKSERWDDAARFASGVVKARANGDFLLIALEILGWVHIGAERPDAALTVLSETLRMRSPASIAPALELSRMLFENGRSGDAFDLLMQAQQCAPTDVSVPLLLADLHQRSGSYPDAVKWLECANAISPESASSRSGVLDSLRATISRNELLRATVQAVGQKITNSHGHAVMSGPFAGVTLSTGHDFAWVATLVGCYEKELHSVIEDAIRLRPTRVVNVGCSGGYYAVGFARRVPEATIYAFDIDASARASCVELANVNEVGGRVVVQGACTPDVLGPLVGSGSLIFCDCEGYELHLLDPEIVPGLDKTAIIVELHDVWVPGLAERLLARFLATHKVHRIGAVPRDWRVEPVATVPGLTEQERAFAVSDWRDLSMSWAYLEPR